MRPELVFLANLCASGGVGWLLLAGYRHIRRHSKVLGLIVAGGVLARASVGLVLFWISYLQLPVATSFQAGDGFWELAPDAMNYFRLAQATGSGSLAPGHEVPSPIFVTTLMLWMSVVGTSPASALLLNVALYIGLITMIVSSYRPVDDWRRDLPCLISVAAFSFSPVLLLHSSQPLKDALSCTLIGIACLGVLGLRHFIYDPHHRVGTRSFAISICALFVATCATAGIRWYYAILMVFAAAVTLIAFAFAGRRRSALSMYFLGSAAVLIAMTLAFVVGVGAPSRQRLFDAAATTPAIGKILVAARAAFANSGGDTNIARPHGTDPAARLDEPLESVITGPGGFRWAINHIEAAAMGAAFMFAPISAVSTVFNVELDGGRGLLAVVDIDTIFQDLAIASIAVLLWTRRHAIGTRMPYIVFGAVLALTTASLMAYVVTNIGTQWRLRLLAMVPLWFLGLGVSPLASSSAVANGEKTAA